MFQKDDHIFRITVTRKKKKKKKKKKKNPKSRKSPQFCHTFHQHLCYLPSMYHDNLYDCILV